MLRYHRQSAIRKLTDVDESRAAASLLPSGTTLLWLANHLADAEVTWIVERFQGRPAGSAAIPHQPTVAGALDRYRTTSSLVDSIILAAGSLETMCPPFDDRPSVNLRWIVSHLLEETARHAGHVDILRELIDGRVGR